MKLAMDSAGRLVVPKEIRREAGIEAGMPLQIQCRDGRIEIEPAPLPVTLERKGRLLVAVPKQEVRRLDAETVERTRRRLRLDRRRGH